jgi:Concanavalin A-like lectin/glucanases superfamily
MFIQGVTLTNISVSDGSFNSNGALLYIDASNSTSYSGSGTSWTDLSGNSNTATITGSPTFTSNGQISYFTFNGAGTQYAATATAKYNQTYTGKTVFIAARLTAITAGTYRCLFGTASGTRNFNTYIYSPSSGVYQIHWSANGLGGFSNNISLVLGQWFIVAVTHTTDGTVRYYFNGQAAGTNTGVTFSQWTSNGNENIAAGDNYWYGDIALCAVYARALSGDEILQDYNALKDRFGNLILYYDPSNPDCYPRSGYTISNLVNIPTRLPGTLSNITYISPVFAYNGSNSQISIADNALIEPGTGDWTMEAWFVSTAFQTGVILGKFSNGGASTDVSYSIRIGSSGSLFAQIGDGVGSYVNSTSYQTSLSTWTQVIYVFKNSAKTLETFINGVSIGSVAHTLSSIKNVTNPLYIGSYNGGEYSQWFNGRIGIVRLYNKALSSTEVSANFQGSRAVYGI